MPAPPPESDPAIVSATGGLREGRALRLRAGGRGRGRWETLYPIFERVEVWGVGG